MRNNDLLPKRPAIFAMLLLLTMAFSACSLPQVTFQRDAKVHAAFEAATVLPGYDYYSSGPEAQPLAIVGIRRGLHFEQGFWKPIALNEKELRDWLWMIGNDTRDPRDRYYGSRILAPDGDEIGIWFSFLDWMVAEITPEGNVVVHTPDQNASNLRRLWGGDRP
ncbi:MAG: hypothetical protein AB1413_05315 [Thermodesulfobacteriota bacterium]